MRPIEGDHGEPTRPGQLVRRHTVDEVLGFLRSILHETRSKRHDMVTHYNVDDLLGTLGFTRRIRPTRTQPGPGTAAKRGV